ncbi:Wzz/FepE/Etk N-terminal domain-containing protein [Idiomarina xiamenensis]|uniref:OtnB protein n=1 Tax=Idiomarina xiamenensis 10-D-4 TaxID=740709 RepID=K2KES9_9GAMM|nr:Wzz/FepE/Etk N-terminal domain-containing protein [Idiomarina xiamenensis]EKE85202.1 OtnB protein [Idiomarina xiamenensis 10-D-4]
MNDEKNQISTASEQSIAIPDNEIDLRELFFVLWNRKWLIIATTFIFAVASVIVALSLPNIYKSEVLLAPAESTNNNSLANMAGQFGGIAGLVGVNFQNNDGSQAGLAMQVIQSRQFTQMFIEKHDLLVPVMAAEGWDLSSNNLIIDEDAYDTSNARWLRAPDGLRGAKPSAQEAYEVFVGEYLNIQQDEETGLYKLSISYYSPYLAEKWVSWLVEDINDVMRERTIAEATKNLEYLNNQLDKTSVAEMQSTFYKLIEEQTKNLMLAEVQDEFVFKVVDPAVVPELKNKPNRALICVLGTFLGGIVSCVMVILISVFRKES